MSRVFLAEDQALGRDVVVKVLAPELVARLSAERFQREILLAASLQQPNVVPVLTAGDAERARRTSRCPTSRAQSLRVRLASRTAAPRRRVP